MGYNIEKISEFTGHSSGIYCLSPGNQAHTIFSGSGDRFIAEWNLESLEAEKFAVKLNSTPYSIYHVKSLNLLIAGTSDGSIHWIDLSKRQELHQFNYHKQAIYRLLAINSDTQLIATSGDGSFSVWDLQNHTHLRTLHLCEEKIRAIAFDQKSKLLAIGSGDHLIRIFETEHFNELYTLKAHTDSVTSLCFHPTLPCLISGGKDAHLNVWDTSKSFDLKKSVPAHNFAIYELSFNPQGNYLASASRDKTVKLWNGENFDLIQRIDYKIHKAHNHSVNSLLWINSNHFVSAGDDRKICYWKVGG